MSHPGSRPPKHLAATGAVLALALALTGCSGGKDKAADKPGPPPPPPSEQAPKDATAAPGSLTLKSTTGLRKPVTYDDKVTVAVSDVRYVKNKAQGPGEMTGKQLTIFTLRFTNGSGKALDLNKVKVLAKYGPRQEQATPTSYANLNDFYGTVAPGKNRTASYAFDLPATGYKSVVLGVSFDATHKTAVFAGSLKH
ncbi:hypothetical protein [Spirillospora sp. NBC_01491]|uniref:hypothetical protein n=1 Tax=Spirillospora sp. NBC_01491 TaxID=2976007 RepID=UPI002E3129DC|nr:hypothetical protein [Spirillospora sp. NBC_01491]